jgi:hypothetical protein
MCRIASSRKTTEFAPFHFGSEVRTDISRRNRAKQSIGQRMQKHVSVGVPGETFVVRQFHATDLAGNSRLELV